MSFGGPGLRQPVSKPIPNLMAPDEMKNLGFREKGEERDPREDAEGGKRKESGR
ncbi:hypothetical protein MMC10_006741 [Thelotrema lepadinum]|nr:hypothetical protein [Thelotrema lepadinum]